MFCCVGSPCCACFGQIFGATDEDVEKLRIVSLYELDMDQMERLMAGQTAADTQAQQQGDSSSSGGGGSDSGSSSGGQSSTEEKK